MCVSKCERATILSLARPRAGGPHSWLGVRSYYQTLFISGLIKLLPLGDFFFLISYLKHKDKGSWKTFEKEVLKELLLFLYFSRNQFDKSLFKF